MVNSVDLIQTSVCGQGHGVAVVTSYSPLLLLVIDATVTHARRSHNRKNTHSTTRYVRLCGERYCYCLCFCWRCIVDL